MIFHDAAVVFVLLLHVLFFREGVVVGREHERSMNVPKAASLYRNSGILLA